ncbi:MAG TPA: zf-TFIIB domain-containing protein [Phycisphaerae bacterium]|nr:zf-TFIIB domain-containing protein [Phycisphaerae bacterium]
MKCPACGNALTELQAGDIKVDACKGGCGGIWFDSFELQKVDESHEHAGEGLLDIERNPGVRPDPSQRRKCPKCDDLVMMRHFAGVKQQVEVDECPGCAGVWLDAGELAAIRTQFASTEERDKATEAYFSKTVGAELAKMAKQSEAEAARARKFARLFRFICPSYYIPGDQPWGAF